MRFYLINLYRADGGLIARLSLPFDTDEDACAHLPVVFASYQECEEIELWEAPRHLQHVKRATQADGKVSARRSRVDPAGDRPASIAGPWRAA